MQGRSSLAAAARNLSHDDDPRASGREGSDFDAVRYGGEQLNFPFQPPRSRPPRHHDCLSTSDGASTDLSSRRPPMAGPRPRGAAVLDCMSMPNRTYTIRATWDKEAKVW